MTTPATAISLTVAGAAQLQQIPASLGGEASRTEETTAIGQPAANAAKPAGPVESVAPAGAGTASGEGATTPPVAYHAVSTGLPADPAAVQAAAIAQQHSMYLGFGSPYTLQGSLPPTYRSGGSTVYYAAGGASTAQSLHYTPKVWSHPGPCYYDPYGMLNPVACIAPMRMSPEDEHADTKLLSVKKQSGWCC